MNIDSSYTIEINNAIRSKAGKARAAKLSPERRREIAIKANQARAVNRNIIKATHVGDLQIGDCKISCAVLENGERVISYTSMMNILGKSRGGKIHKKPKAILEYEKLTGGQIPVFIAVSNLIPFISNDLVEGSKPIDFYHPKQGKTKGFNANIIPLICDCYLDGRINNVLTNDQIKIADRCEIITRALSKVGLVALIDESTGFQFDRENNELQKLFSRFLSKELQPWTKRFPPEYFENIKRMYGLEHLKGNPKFAGHLINKYIYKEISPEVLEELKKRNPISDGGYRKHAHHQMLSTDVGHPALEKQIVKINTLMSASDTKEEFENLFEKSKR